MAHIVVCRCALLVFVTAAAWASASDSSTAVITLTGDTPWVVADGSQYTSLHDDQDSAEPVAFQMALRDVQLDW